MKKSDSKKSYVWYSVRIGFYFLIAYFALGLVFEDFLLKLVDYMFFSLLFTYLLINTFVTSIIHLTKYKEKGIAVASLVLSSILLLAFIYGLFLGLQGMTY